MEYKTKVVINGNGITSETSDSQPYITGVKMSDSVSQNAFAFGATGSSELKFTIVNPNNANLDGKPIEFWVSLVDDGTQSTFDKIYEEIGATENNEYVIENNVATDDEEDDGTEGVDMTAAEIAAADAEITADENNAFTLFDGVNDTVAPVTTEEETEPTWTKIGVFYVYKQSEFNGQISIICYDGFSLMTDIFTPTTATGTIASLYADYCAKVYATYGITVDSSYPMPSGTITWNESISYRDAIGRFASLCGGYADFDEDGQLNINNFVNSNVIISGSDLLSSDIHSGGEVTITGLACNGLVSGDIATLSFDNPYMTQTILDGILAKYKGVRVTGKSISAMWEPGIDAGMFVRVMADDECRAYLKMLNYAESEGYDDEIKANLNAFGSTVQVVSQVIDFNGDAIANINAGLSTFAEVDNPSPTPVKTVAEDANNKATETRNHFWYDSEGAHVSDSAGSTSGKNVLIDSEGMEVRNGADAVASFKETAQIKGTNAILVLSGDSLMLQDIDGNSPFVSTVTGETGETTIRWTRRSDISANTNYIHVFDEPIQSVSEVKIKKKTAPHYVTCNIVSYTASTRTLVYSSPSGVSGSRISHIQATGISSGTIGKTVCENLSVRIDDGVRITDTGTSISVTKTTVEDTTDYLLARAIVNAFSYADAKAILEV